MSKYFSYKNDINDMSCSGVLGKLGFLGKMGLKTVANVGIFVVSEVIPSMITNASEKTLKNPNASSEQKEKAKIWLDKHK